MHCRNCFLFCSFQHHICSLCFTMCFFRVLTDVQEKVHLSQLNGLLSSMYPAMCSEQIQITCSVRTHGAPVPVLSSMRNVMAAKMADIRRAVAADIACVRLLSGMDTHVLVQGTFINSLVRTILACKRFLTSMCSLMYREYTFCFACN